MKNSQYNSHDIKSRCEKKLGIEFRIKKECNGWFTLEDGKKVARITIPNGRKEIPRGTYSSMAKQLKLTIDQFDSLLDCPLHKDKYLDILKDQDLLK